MIHAMDRIQFQIRKDAGVEEFVEQVFATAAAKFGLVDTKVTSLVENTICNYSEGLGFGFGLGSWRLGDLILVDFNPLEGRTPHFNSVFEFIETALRAKFGDTLRLADANSYITAQNTLPISDEARAFHRRPRGFQKPG
jgi:hypothetical protein